MSSKIVPTEADRRAVESHRTLLADVQLWRAQIVQREYERLISDGYGEVVARRRAGEIADRIIDGYDRGGQF